MKNSKAKGIGIGLLIGVVVLGLGGSLSYLTKGFTDWTFDNISIPGISTSDTTSDSEEPGEEPELFPELHAFRALNVGRTLTVTLNPANTSYTTIVWSTSDSTKVTVSPNGDTLSAVITAIAAFGDEVVVTATHVKSGLSATCTCTYLASPEFLTAVVTNGEETVGTYHGEDQNLLDLIVGETYEIVLSLTPTYKAAYGNIVASIFGDDGGSVFELETIDVLAYELSIYESAVGTPYRYVEFNLENYELGIRLDFNCEIPLQSLSMSETSIVF